MEEKFKRDVQSLDGIFNFIAEYIGKNAIDESVAFTVNLVVEELFTNMVKYNPRDANDISISLEREGSQLRICLVDYEAEPFDITKRDEVDTSESMEQRRIGGLGIHIVKKMVDSITYDYSNGQSKITLIKNLENS